MSRARMLATLCLGLVGCAPETIVVAYAPDESPDAPLSEAGPAEAGPPDGAMGDGGLPGFGMPCTSPADCKPGYFCERFSCGDPKGWCEEQPALCSAIQDPVCGCDGISYFNDCVRQMNGVARASRSECKETAKRCNPFTGLRCPSGTYCGGLQRQNAVCDPSTFSAPKCWGLPADCSFAGGARYQSCFPTSTGERPCVNACQAIESEVPHIPVASCRDRTSTQQQ